MTDRTIDLDQRRGTASQHATELRRLLSDVEANDAILRRRRNEVERQLLARPAESWQEAADKARYLLGRYAATTTDGGLVRDLGRRRARPAQAAFARSTDPFAA